MSSSGFDIESPEGVKMQCQYYHQTLISIKMKIVCLSSIFSEKYSVLPLNSLAVWLQCFGADARSEQLKLSE